MSFSNSRAVVALAIVSIAMTACGGGGMTSIPSQPMLGNAQQPFDSGGVMPSDSTSILKKLTKNVTIGSTVDPGNGDTGPRAITVVPSNYAKLKKNDILVCNYDDKAGDAGKGTTLELLAPAAGSKPTTFVQSSKIEGCAGDAVTSGDQVYVAGATAKQLVWVNQTGAIKKTYGSPISMPFADQESPPLYLYSPEYVWIGNGDSGGVDSLSLGGYGTGKATEVINGFPVNKGSGWSASGPSGFAYWCKALPGALQCKAHNGTADTLYIADGDCNAVVAINHASSLLEKDEITVGSGCKTFKCKYPSTTCGTLVKSGSPLNKPFAAAILPNGNLVVANTGNNTLVEMMPSGKVLDTKVVDTGKAPAIFGLFAIGTSDSNTAIYYTDTNSNELHELEQ